MVALLGCCSTISRGSTLCCGLQAAPRSPVGRLYPWPESSVVLSVLGCQQVKHILKHFIAKIKTGTQNSPCTIHLSTAPPNNNFSPFASHLPMSTPDQPILPLSTSSQPPSQRKSQASCLVLFEYSTKKRTIGHQWTSSDILQTSTTQPWVSHHLEQRQ